MDSHEFIPTHDKRKVSCAKCGRNADHNVHTYVVVDFVEMPFLFNLLCDNARPWNKRLRDELSSRVNATASHNAKLELVGKGPNGSGS